MPQSEGRTTVVPRLFLIVTALLLLCRIGVAIYEHANPAQEKSLINWVSVDSLPTRDALHPELQTPELQTGNKLYLLWFTAGWCGPCKVLEQTVFRNKDVVSLINERFIPVKITDRKREDGKNSNQIQVLESKFRLYVFPTMVATLPNKDMDTIDTQIGGGSARGTADFLKRAIKNAPFKIGLHQLVDGKTEDGITTISEWLTKSSWADSRSVYASLFLSAAYVDKHDLEKARQVLKQAQEKARGSAWPTALLKYLDQTKEKILELAEEDHSQLLDSHYFAGALLLSKGDTKGARSEFDWVKQHGTKEQYSCQSAIAQLKHLDENQKSAKPESAKPDSAQPARPAQFR